MAVILAPAAYSSKVKIYAGEAALDGTNPTPVVTPFKTIYSVAWMLQGAVTPGDGTRLLTYSVSGGTVNFYAWKAAVADPTLEASTGTDTFSYVIVGR